MSPQIPAPPILRLGPAYFPWLHLDSPGQARWRGQPVVSHLEPVVSPGMLLFSTICPASLPCLS